MLQNQMKGSTKKNKINFFISTAALFMVLVILVTLQKNTRTSILSIATFFKREICSQWHHAAVLFLLFAMVTLLILISFTITGTGNMAVLLFKTKSDSLSDYGRLQNININLPPFKEKYQICLEKNMLSMCEM
jgi:cell division protein FtsW (lipid II flippase)